ncbi:hypothetical protein FRC10_000270 [Ceratobasidium sp. 414]|nr:hypothetical protein FRC10_000270 [Ceratobasidium sp. 414]
MDRWFEELIASTIEQTKDIPEALSEAGKIGMPHGEIMRQIGQLFLLRMNINLVGNVLDAPELFWDFPDLKPMYEAARSYLELPQRIDLLNARVEVLQDMLKLLKESVTSRHGERLEQIVIVLIGIEICTSLVSVLCPICPLSRLDGVPRALHAHIPPLDTATHPRSSGVTSATLRTYLHLSPPADR